ncbi:twin-arginine translocase subunit TatC [bacterium]|nr:twin-arginine translocase subunit TatC [bacterium]
MKAVFGISNVINLSIGLALTFGLMFQVPLVTHFLIKFNIISYESIKSKRPYVIVILLVFAALLTPPDIVSQLFLFLPTYILFEAGLLFSKK